MKQVRFSLIALLFLFVISSCGDKDDLYLKDKDGLIHSISENESAGAPESALVFDYDKQARVKKIGNKEFHYGSNGKVSYSIVQPRSSFSLPGESYEQRLSYKWDSQGRLTEVILDKLSVKNSQNPEFEYIYMDDMWIKNLVENIKIASFTYEGSSLNPKSIITRPISTMIRRMDEGQEMRVAYHIEKEKESVFHYENNNVVRWERRVTEFPGSVAEWVRVEVDNFRYSSTPHYLYGIYKQLGFHPFKLGEVVSADLANASISTSGELSVPDWSIIQSQYKIKQDEKGRTNEVSFYKILKSGPIGSGMISISAFPTVIKVRYY